jgi:hypothetical protein
MMQIMLQHKEVALLCKEGMTPTKAQNALLVSQINKIIRTPKPHMERRTTSKHCINYGRDEKKEPIVTTTKVITQNQKLQKTTSCACHICGMNGHKMIDCPKFVKM